MSDFLQRPTDDNNIEMTLVIIKQFFGSNGSDSGSIIFQFHGSGLKI